MAGIIYELIEVLDEEKECYEGLVTLAEYKQVAIVNKNIEFLGEVTNREEAFVGRVSILDRKREELMKDVAIVLGIRQEKITITSIIEKIGWEKENSQKLIQLKQSIAETVELVRRQNELNKQLIQDSLEMIDFMITAIKEQKRSAYVGNYGKNGSNTNLGYANSEFDIKK